MFLLIGTGASESVQELEHAIVEGCGDTITTPSARHQQSTRVVVSECNAIVEITSQTFVLINHLPIKPMFESVLFRIIHQFLRHVS